MPETVGRLQAKLDLNLRPYQAGINRATGIARGFVARTNTLMSKVGAGFNVQNMVAGVGRVGNAFGNLNSTLKFSHVLLFQIGQAIVRDFVQGIVQLDRLDKAFGAVFGRLEGITEFQYVTETADKLGIQITDLADAYLNLNAAAAATNLTSKETRGIFEAVSGAMAVLGRSTADTRGALRAVEQMISKGKVQAEELRGQLGERLPGAYITAAKSMGLTTQELEDQLKAGKILAEDFLPKFAAELKKTYSPEAIGGIRHLSAEWARLRNEIIRFYDDILDAGGLEGIQGIVKGITEGLKEFRASWVGDLSIDLLATGFSDIARTLEIAVDSARDFNMFIEEIAGANLSSLNNQVEGLIGMLRGDAGLTGISLLDNTPAGALLSRTAYNIGLIPTLDEQKLKEERDKAEAELAREAMAAEIDVNVDTEDAKKTLAGIDGFTGSSSRQSGDRWIKTLEVESETGKATREIDLFWRKSIDGRQWSRTFEIKVDSSGDPEDKIKEFIKTLDIRQDDVMSTNNAFLNEQFAQLAKTIGVNVFNLKQMLRKQMPEVLKEISITDADLDVDVSNDSFIKGFFEQYEELDKRTRLLVDNLHEQVQQMPLMDVKKFLNADDIDKDAARIVAALVSIQRQGVEVGASPIKAYDELINALSKEVSHRPGIFSFDILGEIQRQLNEAIDPVSMSRVGERVGKLYGTSITHGLEETLRRDKQDLIAMMGLTGLASDIELAFGIKYDEEKLNELADVIHNLRDDDFKFNLELDVFDIRQDLIDVAKDFVNTVTDLFSNIPLDVQIDVAGVEKAASRAVTIMKGNIPTTVMIPVREQGSGGDQRSLPMDRSSVGTLDISSLAKDTTSKEIANATRGVAGNVDALKAATTDGLNLLTETQRENLKEDIRGFANQAAALRMGLDRLYKNASLSDLGDLAGLMSEGTEAAQEQANLMGEMLAAQDKVADLQQRSNDKMEETTKEIEQLNKELGSGIPKIGDGINTLERTIESGANETVSAIGVQTREFKNALSGLATEINATLRNGFLNMSSGTSLASGGGIGGGVIDAFGNRSNSVSIGRDISQFSAGVANPFAQGLIEFMQEAQFAAEQRARADAKAAEAAQQFANELNSIVSQTSSLENQITAFKSGLQDQFPAASLDQLAYLIELQERSKNAEQSGSGGGRIMGSGALGGTRIGEDMEDAPTDLLSEFKKMLMLQEELNELTSSVDDNTGETALNTRDDELKDLIKPISQALAEERRKTGQTMRPLENAKFPSEAIGDTYRLRQSDQAKAAKQESTVNVNFTNVDDQKVKSTLFSAMRQGIPTGAAQASAFTNIRALKRA